MEQEKTSQTQEDFLDFELEIGTGNNGIYPITVIQSPAGEAHEQMHFPYDKLTLENQLLTLQNALLRSATTSRQALLPEQQQVQNFGGTLFATLFSGEVGNLYTASRDEAVQQGKGLRLKLHFLAPEMASLPWEFLYDPVRAEYLCLSRYTPIVRYLDLPQPPQSLSVVLPLRVLGVVAAPSNLPPLDSKGEQQRMEQALQPLQQRGLVQLTWLAGQTWQSLQEAMRQGPWHILHFIGHGSFDTLADEGVIAFADEAGQAQMLRATQLGLLLADHLPLRLVVLNSCEGAEGSRHDVFSSTAAILIRAGLPAVLAMQYSITDSAAIALSQAFYRALADGLPVDAVVSEARKAVSLAGGDTLEWGIPVLYMRSPDGVLFTIDRSAPPVPAQSAPVASPAQRSADESLLSRRNLLIGLGGLAAAGGTAGGIWLFTHRGNPSPPPDSSTVTSDPTVTTVQIEASETAQARVNGTATATVQQNRYVQATSGIPIFTDPLIDNGKGYGWNVGSGYCTFVGGSLHSKRPSPGALNCDATGARSFDNFAFQVSMTIISGDAGGIDFRISPANNDGYYFSIGQDGSYRFYRSGDSTLQLLTSGVSSAVHTGLYQTNLVTVIAQGNMFDLYVNTQYITTVTDGAYDQGFIGVFAEDQRNSTEVVFNHVKVWSL